MRIAACFLVGWWGLRWGGGPLFRGEVGLERRLCGAVVAAVPRKRSGNRRCVSWSKGTGCGGAESLFFGERPARAEVSAGRWLLSRSEDGRLPASCCLVGGDGPRRGGGRLFRGGERRLGQKFLRGSVCYLAPKTAGCRRRTCWLEGTDRGGAASLFFGERRVRTRFPSPPLFAATARCYRSLLPLSATARRLSLFSACHYPPPATSATVACHPCRCLPSRGLSPSPACHYLIIRCCLHLRRFSPAAPAVSLPAACYLRPLPPLLTASSPPASPLSVAFPRLSLLPAARRYRPPLPLAACRLPPSSFPCLSSSAVACTPAASHPPLPPAATVACHPRYSPQSATTRCLPFPPPCAGRADGWAAAAPRVVGRGAMRRRREVLRNNLENRKILPIFVSVKYRGSGLSRPGFLFFIGLSFLWQKRLSI